MYSSSAYAPFGEPYATAGTSDTSFTGPEQDTISGLYDFLYRRLSQTQGRWTSPDPSGLGAVSLENPQSFNRYAYVMNRSSELVDPKGLNADAGSWWLEWRFNSTGTTWDGDMIGGGGGGFPSAMEEILATSYQDYLNAVEANFTVTTEVTCADGTVVTLSGSYTKEQAAASGVCTEHGSTGLDSGGPAIPFALYFVDPANNGQGPANYHCSLVPLHADKIGVCTFTCAAPNGIGGDMARIPVYVIQKACNTTNRTCPITLDVYPPNQWGPFEFGRPKVVPNSCVYGKVQ
jgi:RHS repeat-associated protein